MKRKQVKINSPEELQKGDVINGILIVNEVRGPYVYFDEYEHNDTWIPVIKTTVVQWLKDGATVTREVEEKPMWSGKLKDLAETMMARQEDGFLWKWDDNCLAYSMNKGATWTRSVSFNWDTAHRNVTEYRPVVEPVVVEFETVIIKDCPVGSVIQICDDDAIAICKAFNPQDIVRVRIEKVSK